MRASQGRHRASVRYFHKALEVARQRELTFEVAKILLDLAVVQEEGRDANRREAVAILKKLKSVIPNAEAWLLGNLSDKAVVAPDLDLEAWARDNELKIGELEIGRIVI